MKPSTVLLFCGLIFALAINLSDGQNVRKKSTAKVQVQKLSKGKKGTTVAPVKAKGTTKKKKKKVPPKSSKTNDVQEIPTTVIDEFAADSDAGHDCYDSCFADSKLLDASGKISNPSQYGDFKELCDTTYLFGTKMVTWEENWKTCCSIGMQPVTFKTVQNSDCVQRAVQSGEVSGAAEKQYWSGGFENKINKAWFWCAKDTPDLIDESFNEQIYPDRVKKTTTEESCLQISYDSRGGLNRNDCAAKNLYLICQALPKKPTPAILPGTKCRAKCSTTCSKKSMLFELNGKQEQELSERYKYGRWVSKCGRYYLFSTKTATYEEARRTCCSMGANLLSMKSTGKRKCLPKLARDYPDIVGEYWTSGTDTGCDGNFRWCSVDRAFLKEEVHWAPSEPDRSRGNCVWTRTSSSFDATSLATENCEMKKKFICEVRQSGITPEAIHKECATLLDLTPVEVDNLSNLDKYTYKMKCYLQCMGDNLGALINGTLKTGHLVRLMDNAKVKAEKSSESAIQKCEIRKDKNDECQNAYLIFKCTKEQAPKEFELMVNHYKYKDVPVEIKEPRVCEMDTRAKCGSGTNLAREYSMDGKTSVGGVSIVGLDGTKWYKSEYAAKHSYEYAFETCCKLNMHLPWAVSLEDFKKLYDFLNGSSTDNFYAETYSTPEGEKWCKLDKLLDLQMSSDGFRQLEASSLLYTQKNFQPMYKLKPVLYSEIESVVNVNHFYCQPNEDGESK